MTKILNLYEHKNKNHVLVLKNFESYKKLSVGVSNVYLNPESIHSNGASGLGSNSNGKRLTGLVVILLLFVGGYWVVSQNTKTEVVFSEPVENLKSREVENFEFREAEDSIGSKVRMGGGVEFPTGVWETGVKDANSCLVYSLLRDPSNLNVIVSTSIEKYGPRGWVILRMKPFRVAKIQDEVNKFQFKNYVDMPHFSTKNGDTTDSVVKVKIGVDEIEIYNFIYSSDIEISHQSDKLGSSEISYDLPMVDFTKTKRQSFTVNFLTSEGYVNIPIGWNSPVIQRYMNTSLLNCIQ